MSRDSRFLRRTYNAVITSVVAGRDQLALVPTDSLHSEGYVQAVDTVVFEMFVQLPHRSPLEKLSSVIIHVESRPGESEMSLVRRAAKEGDIETRRAWWEFDATRETTALSDVVLEQTDRLPDTALIPAYVGLTVVEAEDAYFEPLYSGDKNAL